MPENEKKSNEEKSKKELSAAEVLRNAADWHEAYAGWFNNVWIPWLESRSQTLDGDEGGSPTPPPPPPPRGGFGNP